MSRRLRFAAAALVTPLLLTGCEFKGIYDVPLPGGAAFMKDAYRVQVELDDVLDLVPQSSVRVNDVAVGSVEDIVLDDWHAVVTLKIRDDVVLPDNAIASLRQTSILGEKFVSLAPPTAEEPQGRLSEGDRIPIERTQRSTELEEVFSALALVLNGGSVEQLRTINRELAAVFAGREDRIKSVLQQLDTFVGGLDEQKASIIRALENLNRLNGTLAQQRETIQVALDDLPPGLEVLADQQDQLTEMFTALSELGEVGTRVINASLENTVADLKALAPILDRLTATGNELPLAFELLFTYPFPRTIDNAIFGDYTNLEITLDTSIEEILANLENSQGGESPLPLPLPGASGAPSVPSIPGTPSLPGGTPSVPGLPVPVPSSGATRGGGLLGGDTGLLRLMMGGLV